MCKAKSCHVNSFIAIFKNLFLSTIVPWACPLYLLTRLWLTRRVVATTSDIYITMMDPCVPCSTFELMLPLLSILYFSYVYLSEQEVRECQRLNCYLNALYVSIKYYHLHFCFECLFIDSVFCRAFLCCERCSPRVDWAGADV